MTRKMPERLYRVDEEFTVVSTYLVTASSKAAAIKIVHDDVAHERCEAIWNSDAQPTGRWWAHRAEGWA